MAELYVETHGDPQGQPVMLLHAAQISGWMWTEVAGRLREFHCIVPDLPGIHRSRATPWESFDRTGQQIAELIGQQQRKVHLVGLSLGAAVALRVMHAAPQAIDRAVLSGTLTRPVTGATASLNKLLVWMYGNPRTAPLVGRMFQLPPEDRPVFAETARLTPKDTYPRLLGELYRTPFPDKLKSIDVPILAITGEKDAGMLKSGVGDLVKTLPNAVGYYAPGVGHAWSAENPTLFADVVRAWLLDKPLPEVLIPHAA